MDHDTALTAHALSWIASGGAAIVAAACMATSPEVATPVAVSLASGLAVGADMGLESRIQNTHVQPLKAQLTDLQENPTGFLEFEQRLKRNLLYDINDIERYPPVLKAVARYLMPFAVTYGAIMMAQSMNG